MRKAESAISLGIVAIIVIALIIIVGFGVYLDSTFKTTRTSFVGSTAAPFTGREYQVTFKQIAACKSFPPAFWGIPWSVTINNTTEVDPPGTPLPLNNLGPLHGTFDQSFSEINFTLSNGTYSYTVAPTSEFFTPDTGTITVAGSNLTVPIQYSGTSCTVTSKPSQQLRTGPISNFPAAWGLYSSCAGFPKQGNMTTIGIGNVTYPNSWNTTTIVTLDQVYQSIIGSSAFANITLSNQGWVIYSWSFVQGGSDNPFPNGNDIVGSFILTNASVPDGYVTAYYNIGNGNVALGALTTTVTVYCPSLTTSRTTNTSI